MVCRSVAPARRSGVPVGGAVAPAAEALTPEAVQHALHELRVHQAELEMQNEELRRTLAELDAAREHFFDFYDLAPLGYCTVDASGLVQQANLAAATLLGVARRTLVGQSLSHFIDKANQDIWYQSRQLAIETRQCQVCELWLLRPGGAAWWAQLDVIAAQDDEGAPVLHLVLSDITERRQREEQLRLQALVLDQISDEVTITELNGVVTYVNQVGVRRSDRIGTDMVGQHVTAFGESPLADASQQEIAEATLARGAWRGMVAYALADGSSVLTDLRTTLVRDEAGTPVAMVGVGTDITLRRRAQEELRLREQYKRALLDNFPFMVWLKDERGRYLAVNEAFAAAYGWASADSMVGHNVFDITDPERAAQYLTHDLAVLSSGDKREIEELVETDGQQRWFENHKAPVRIDGKVVGTVGYSRDITERKQTLIALEQARAQAQSANRAKSRMLAAVSHDLRQPLSALALYVSVLQQRIPPQQADLVAKIQNCCESLSVMFTDLLSLGKLDSGGVIPEPTDFDVNDFLGSLVSLHASQAASKGLELRCRPCHRSTHTDRALLARLVGNLIDNAICHADKGGVLVACRRHAGAQWIEIWDTGVGIAQDQYDLIFEEYRQLDEGSRKQGSGLGLSIVARMATLLGLKIRLRSRVGRGSLFAVELPPPPDFVANRPLAPGLYA